MIEEGMPYRWNRLSAETRPESEAAAGTTFPADSRHSLVSTLYTRILLYVRRTRHIALLQRGVDNFC